MADDVVRDDKGRFVKGHSGNPRGKPIDQWKRLKKIDIATTQADWRAIIDKAVEQAKRGDSRAREWLSDYLVGKPTQGIDITSGGETIIDAVNRDRSLSALADAIRAGLSSEDTSGQSDMDTTEQTAVAIRPDEG